MTTRRGFVTGCSAAVAAYAGANVNTLAFGAPGDTSRDVIVSIFLRGGIDGLNLIMPTAGADRGHYEAARPDIAVPVSGASSALPLGGGLGIHRAIDAFPSGEVPPATLWDLYQGGKVSLVVGTGMHTSNRSHFDSMAYMELGTPGTTSTSTGWLTRHLQTVDLPPDPTMLSLAAGNMTPTSLRGRLDSVNMSSPGSFSLNVGPWQWRDAWRVALRNLYGAANGGNTWLHTSGSEALDTIDIIELHAGGDYEPANGAIYPGGSLGSHLQTIARMIKLDLGLQVATVDFGGWDTHNGQGDDGGGYFSAHLQELARGLAAFYTDLDGAGASNYVDRVTVVVNSEFGRRLRQNADRGSDHGHGCMMMVMSGNATGGVHGVWPGLANGQLFDGADLEVTTDYRRVLSEILIRRTANPYIGDVFPSYQGYQPLGVVQGTDLTPLGPGGIFADNFESGGLGAWSASSGG
ncbi:MAG: DUF1501 domain-containing protein [Thermoanaerobaculia bacterium]|nr:DUF1501 domain-containing protein [Thermoanaerobaculia bacterium]